MASYQYVYVMKGLGKTYPGGKQVLSNITLSFLPGAKIGVLGINGSGKSTLLKIMAGLDEEYVGEAWAAEGVKIGYLAQEPQLNPDKDVLGNVMEGVAETQGLVDRYNEISARFAEELTDDEMMALSEEMGDLQEKIDAADAWELDRRVEIAMDALRLPANDADVNKLSGGERRRVALCKLLLEKPDMLLLDEPTNHLDAESVAWLENFLKDYSGTVVMITHDRYFLDNVTGWILELDRGAGIPYEGNYSAWLEQKQKRLLQEERTEANRQKALEQELDWVRSSPKARQSKNKARLKAYEELASQDQDKFVTTNQIYIPVGERLGQNVLEFDGVSKGFGERLLIDDLSFKLQPGSIVGIVGPNGAGKSTFFKMITGQEQPDNGTVKVGESVELGYVDQSRDTLNDGKTVWEEISDGLDELALGKASMNSRAYVGNFNFKGKDQQKKVGQLSGGERNRVHLAKLLKGGFNFLLLDEPTNDLDVDTLRALEIALNNYAGCAMVISHDRYFLDRVATHIIGFESNSHVEFFEGSYTDYAVYYKEKYGEDAERPHRVKYKKFER